jgi:hypothetical protein
MALEMDIVSVSTNKEKRSQCAFRTKQSGLCQITADHLGLDEMLTFYGSHPHVSIPMRISDLSTRMHKHVRM